MVTIPNPTGDTQTQPIRISVTEVDTLLYDADRPKFRVKDRFTFPGISYKVIAIQEKTGMLKVSIHEDAHSRSRIEPMTVSQLDAKLKAHAQPEPAPVPIPTPQPTTESLQKQLADLQASVSSLEAQLKAVREEKNHLETRVAELTKVQPKPVIGHHVYNVNNDAQRAMLATKYAECLQNGWPIHQFQSCGAVMQGQTLIANFLMLWQEKPKAVEQPDGKILELAKVKPA